MQKIIGLTVAALFLAGSAYAGAPGKKAKIKDAPLVCPVMGGKIDSKAKAAGSHVYKGVRYYFCCGDCPAAFKKDPARYVKDFPAKVKKAGVKTGATGVSTQLTKVMVCPIMGQRVEGKGGGTSVVGNYEVHFCCGGCKPTFDKLSDAQKKAKIAEALKKS